MDYAKAIFIFAIIPSLSFRIQKHTIWLFKIGGSAVRKFFSVHG